MAINCWFERLDGQPVETPVQELCASVFDNEFASARFGAMSIYSELSEARHQLFGPRA